MCIIMICLVLLVRNSVNNAILESKPNLRIDEQIQNPFNGTLDDLIDFLAIENNTIILATFQGDYHVWVSNWLTFIHWHGRYNQTLLVAVTRQECEPLWQAGLRCFVHQELWDSRAQLQLALDPLVRDCTSAVVLKWYYIWYLLQRGVTVLFSDLDMVFVQDPFLLVDPHWDLMALSDFCRPLNRTTWSRPRHECFLYHQIEPCLSTGLMVFQNTPSTLNYVQAVWLWASRSPTWEQAVANYVLPQFMEHELRYRLLDDHVAANCLVFRQLDLPWSTLTRHWIAIHAGYMHEFESKSSVFRELGLWFPDPLYHYRLRVPGVKDGDCPMDRIPSIQPHDWCIENDCVRFGIVS